MAKSKTRKYGINKISNSIRRQTSPAQNVIVNLNIDDLMYKGSTVGCWPAYAAYLWRQPMTGSTKSRGYRPGIRGGYPPCAGKRLRSLLALADDLDRHAETREAINARPRGL
jgi:hypothetical protein